MRLYTCIKKSDSTIALLVVVLIFLSSISTSAFVTDNVNFFNMAFAKKHSSSDGGGSSSGGSGNSGSPYTTSLSSNNNGGIRANGGSTGDGKKGGEGTDGSNSNNDNTNADTSKQQQQQVPIEQQLSPAPREITVLPNQQPSQGQQPRLPVYNGKILSAPDSSLFRNETSPLSKLNNAAPREVLPNQQPAQGQQPRLPAYNGKILSAPYEP